MKITKRITKTKQPSLTHLNASQPKHHRPSLPSTFPPSSPPSTHPLSSTLFNPICLVSHPLLSKYARNLISSAVIVSCPICGRQNTAKTADKIHSDEATQNGYCADCVSFEPAASIYGKTFVPT